MRGGALAVVIALAGAVAIPAGATVQRDSLIRPGVGIGKLRLGMTPAQVRAAMGRPLAVVPLQGSFGRAAVEWQYDYGAYTARLEGRRNALRVTAVATTVTRERTQDGLGVGTLESRLERAYAGRIRCERLRTGGAAGGRSDVIVVLDPTRDCVVPQKDGTRTVFVTAVKVERTNTIITTPERWENEARVLSVEVRAA